MECAEKGINSNNGGGTDAISAFDSVSAVLPQCNHEPQFPPHVQDAQVNSTPLTPQQISFYFSSFAASSDGLHSVIARMAATVIPLIQIMAYHQFI